MTKPFTSSLMNAMIRLMTQANARLTLINAASCLIARLTTRGKSPQLAEQYPTLTSIVAPIGMETKIAGQMKCKVFAPTNAPMPASCQIPLMTKPSGTL